MKSASALDGRSKSKLARGAVGPVEALGGIRLLDGLAIVTVAATGRSDPSRDPPATVRQTTASRNAGVNARATDRRGAPLVVVAAPRPLQQALELCQLDAIELHPTSTAAWAAAACRTVGSDVRGAAKPC